MCGAIPPRSATIRQTCIRRPKIHICHICWARGETHLKRTTWEHRSASKHSQTYTHTHAHTQIQLVQLFAYIKRLLTRNEQAKATRTQNIVCFIFYLISTLFTWTLLYCTTLHLFDIIEKRRPTSIVSADLWEALKNTHHHHVYRTSTINMYATEIVRAFMHKITPESGGQTHA